MIHFHIITLFPDSLRSYLDASIIGRARKAGHVQVSLYNPRDFTEDAHGRVDRKPYGGGPGMVLEALPILRAVKKAVGRKKNVRIFITAPGGKEFNGAYAETLAREARHVVIIAGHYEGIDARVKEALSTEEISIGPYILTGGELPALVMVDAVARHVPGVLGKAASLEDARVASGEVYTRPESFVFNKKTYVVPEVLRSGHHENIESWRKERSGARKNGR